jgi:hypothetical protein
VNQCRRILLHFTSKRWSWLMKNNAVKFPPLCRGEEM